MFAARCGFDSGSCETPYGLTLRYNYGNIKSYIDYVIKGREKMRIAVCDDNAVFLQFFKSMLANELESRSVKAEIETFTKAESFFYCHGKKPFSAIFLDLDMPEITGFEVARQLGQNGNCFVIFVTSHQELVYDSFNFRPLNFICKDPDADVMKDRLHMVAGQLTDALKQEKTVVLENREQGRISVKLRDVTYIESNSHSIIYHFANNKDTIAVRDSIGEIEEAYRKFDFIRVHKKYIVNLKYVFNISRSNETVIFKSGSELPMSRGYKNAVDDALTEYLRRK